MVKVGRPMAGSGGVISLRATMLRFVTQTKKATKPSIAVRARMANSFESDKVYDPSLVVPGVSNVMMVPNETAPETSGEANNPEMSPCSNGDRDSPYADTDPVEEHVAVIANTEEVTDQTGSTKESLISEKRKKALAISSNALVPPA